MNQQWTLWSEKLSQLQEREKLMVLGVGVFLILYLSIWFFIAPLQIQFADNKKQLKKTQQSLAQGKVRLDMFTQALKRDYTASIRQEIQKTEQSLSDLDQKLDDFSQGFIPPYKMPAVLKSLLMTKKNLTLKSFQLEPVIPIVLGTDTQTQKVAFYEHGMKLVVTGDFFSLLAYVKNINEIKEKLFIQQFRYKVLNYPEAELQLVIATVSANEKFIAL